LRPQALGIVLAACAACSPASLERLAGPEDQTLVQRLSGTILVCDEEQRIVRIELPGLEREEVLPPRTAARGVSNVDAAGEFVFVQYSRPWRMTRVSAASGESHVVAESARPVRDYVIGAIALAADGSRAALAWDAERRPDARLAGHLDVVKLADGDSFPTAVTVFSEHMGWLPGDRELVVEVLLPKEEAGAMAGDVSWARVDDDQVSAIVALDPDTGAMRSIARGHAPVLDAEGACVLSRLDDGSYLRTELPSGRESAWAWPGDHGGPLAVACDGHVVYLGLPTEGRPVIETRYYSPAVGARELPDIKLADPTTGEFATLVEGVDVRHPLSFSLRPSR